MAKSKNYYNIALVFKGNPEAVKKKHIELSDYLGDFGGYVATFEDPKPEDVFFASLEDTNSVFHYESRLGACTVRLRYNVYQNKESKEKIAEIHITVHSSTVHSSTKKKVRQFIDEIVSNSEIEAVEGGK